MEYRRKRKMVRSQPSCLFARISEQVTSCDQRTIDGALMSHIYNVLNLLSRAIEACRLPDMEGQNPGDYSIKVDISQTIVKRQSQETVTRIFRNRAIADLASIFLALIG